ncbi:HepT-like ribonuclease domain-containing protein [Paenibacillus sp. CMAA1364]
MNRSLTSLLDILESMNRIDIYIGGVEYDSFLDNQMLIDAVIRNLEIIGEAARNVSDEVRNKYPDIPWRNMIGLRNILIHQYFGVDESIVWEVIKTNLPESRPNLVKAIQEEGDIT